MLELKWKQKYEKITVSGNLNYYRHADIRTSHISCNYFKAYRLKFHLRAYWTTSSRLQSNPLHFTFPWALTIDYYAIMFHVTLDSRGGLSVKSHRLAMSNYFVLNPTHGWTSRVVVDLPFPFHWRFNLHQPLNSLRQMHRWFTIISFCCTFVMQGRLIDRSLRLIHALYIINWIFLCATARVRSCTADSQHPFKLTWCNVELLVRELMRETTGRTIFGES